MWDVLDNGNISIDFILPGPRNKKRSELLMCAAERARVACSALMIAALYIRLVRSHRTGGDLHTRASTRGYPLWVLESGHVTVFFQVLGFTFSVN